jgi:hypothetical protein
MYGNSKEMPDQSLQRMWKNRVDDLHHIGPLIVSLRRSQIWK